MIYLSYLTSKKVYLIPPEPTPEVTQPVPFYPCNDSYEKCA